MGLHVGQAAGGDKLGTRPRDCGDNDGLSLPGEQSHSHVSMFPFPYCGRSWTIAP